MAAAGQNGEHRIAGPRLIAIVGPFQSGKTSLLEGLLVRARRRGAARLGARGHQRRRLQPRGARPRDERRAEHRQRRLHGRPLHLLRLPRLGRVLPRHALRAAGLRRGDRRVRGRSAQGAGVAGDPARARGAPRSAHPVSQQDRPRRRRACARRWRCCSPPRARRCCCARSRSGRTASPPASSISRWSAPSSTASGSPRRWSRCRPASPATKSRRAIPCSSASPTTTTR